MFDLHINRSKDDPCPHGDFLLRLAFALWKNDRWRTLFCAAFSPPNVGDSTTYIRWLREQSADGRYLNLHHVALWAYQTRSGKKWE